MDFFDVVTTQRAMRRLKPESDPRRRAPADHGRRHLRAERRQPPGLELRDSPRRGQAGAARRAVPRGMGRADEGAVLRGAPRRSRPTAPRARCSRRPDTLSEHLGEAPVLILACIALDPGAHADADHRRVDLSGRPEHHAGGARPRHRQLSSRLFTGIRDAQVKELLGIPADVETAALIPLGYPLGAFGRPPRRPLHEVAFADRWGDAF